MELLSHSRAERFALARDAMALRRRVLDLMSTDDDGPTALSVASEEAWRAFLTIECCALPLASELRRRRLGDRLDAKAHAALRRAELLESQRVLAARSTLDALDGIGVQLGIPIVVLKGGAAAAVTGAPAYDLGDVDILVTADGLERVWNALRESGWHPRREAVVPGVRTDRNHFEPIFPPESGLPVELHRDAQYGQRDLIASSFEPIPGRASLHRLGRLNAIRLMLWHSVVQHPHRRGHLRDLFMLRDALRQLSLNDGEALDASVAADPFAPELREVLGAATSLGNSGERSSSRHMEHFVAWKYATLLEVDWVVDELLPGWSALGHIPLERRAIRWRALRAELRSACGALPRESRFRRIAYLPAPMQTAVGWFFRAAARVIMLVLLLLVGRRVRRVADALVSNSAR